jgi:hypothetical protein
VWYQHDAFGAAIGAASGLRVYSGGDAEDLRAAAALGSRSLVLSIKAYGTGFDGLQRAYSRALVTNSPSSGDAWEQAIGRLHRRGQAADEVVYEVYRHTPEVASAIDKAVAQAKYVEGVTGGRQALLAADVEWQLDPAAAAADDPPPRSRPGGVGPPPDAGREGLVPPCAAPATPAGNRSSHLEPAKSRRPARASDGTKTA